MGLLRHFGCSVATGFSDQRVGARFRMLADTTHAIRAAGVMSLWGIAAALNERGIPTVAGSGRWRHVQVGQLLARLAG
jgi:hypothetical protein